MARVGGVEGVQRNIRPEVQRERVRRGPAVFVLHLEDGDAGGPLLPGVQVALVGAEREEHLPRHSAEVGARLERALERQGPVAAVDVEDQHLGPVALGELVASDVLASSDEEAGAILGGDKVAHAGEARGVGRRVNTGERGLRLTGLEGGVPEPGGGGAADGPEGGVVVIGVAPLAGGSLVQVHRLPLDVRAGERDAGGRRQLAGERVDVVSKDAVGAGDEELLPVR